MGRERVGFDALNQALLPKGPAHAAITRETLVERREHSLEFWSLDLVHGPGLTLSKYLAQAEKSRPRPALPKPGDLSHD